MNIQNKILKTCKYLRKEINPKAILHFGSTLEGNYWKESDVDLFIITNKSKEHTAFYSNIDGLLYHCNVTSEKAFGKYLSNPLRTAIQNLFVDSNVYFDKTNWIKNEKIRLKKYPKKYRIYRIIDRMEHVLAFIYKLRKYEYFKKKNIENPIIGFEKLLEMECIDKGKYFGKTVYDFISKKDKKIWQNIHKFSIKKQLAILKKRLNPLMEKYIPLFIKDIKRYGKTLNYTIISRKAGLDLELVYREAQKMGIISLKEKLSNTNGFPFKEETIFIKKD